MADPFVGEIRMFAGNFAPAGWAFCEGQLIPIDQNETLFNLIGTTYGGDGQNTFALPDLRGRVPVHVGPGFAQGQLGGVETVTLTTSQLPAHTHTLFASSDNATQINPIGRVLAQNTGADPYRSGGSLTQALAVTTIASDGGSQPHDNLQPYLCVNFILSLFGVFPSQT
jgi:microcystin-dependent protein